MLFEASFWACCSNNPISLSCLDIQDII
uniref:Uncharacterized protein n=1 Tax=Anguilla anguilla TaxID=7936 RepID=A0A0E9TME8_ANGAN